MPYSSHPTFGSCLPRTIERPGRESGDECSELPRREAPQSHGRKPVVRGLPSTPFLDGTGRNMTLAAINPLRVTGRDFLDRRRAAMTGITILPHLKTMRNWRRTVGKRRPAEFWPANLLPGGGFEQPLVRTFHMALAATDQLGVWGDWGIGMKPRYITAFFVARQAGGCLHHCHIWLNRVWNIGWSARVSSEPVIFLQVPN